MPLQPTTSTNLDLNVKIQGGYKVLLVRGSSNTHALAGVLMKCARDGEPILARAIGAGAVNQAAKACAMARKFGSQEQMTLTFSVEFTTVMVDGMDRSALSFILNVVDRGEPRNLVEAKETANG